MRSPWTLLGQSGGLVARRQHSLNPGRSQMGKFSSAWHLQVNVCRQAPLAQLLLLSPTQTILPTTLLTLLPTRQYIHPTNTNYDTTTTHLTNSPLAGGYVCRPSCYKKLLQWLRALQMIRLLVLVVVCRRLSLSFFVVVVVSLSSWSFVVRGTMSDHLL